MKKIGIGGRLVLLAFVAGLLLVGRPPVAAVAIPSSSALVAADEAAKPTTVSLSAELSPLGTEVWLRMLLRDDASVGVGGATLFIETSHDASTWTDAKTVMTWPGGSVDTVVPISRTTYYRIRYEGLESEYQPSESALSGILFTPRLAWTSFTGSGFKYGDVVSLRVSSGLGAHDDVDCPGAIFRVSRLESGQWVERMAVPASSTANPDTGLKDYAATMTPPAGAWRAVLEVGADSAHAAAASAVNSFSVGGTKVSLLLEKTSVRVGTKVTLRGYLRYPRTLAGITGQSVRLETSVDGGTTWSTVKTVKSGADGKLSVTVTPMSQRKYRYVYGGSTAWSPCVSDKREVRTWFTLTGRSAGHFRTKKVFMSVGTRNLTLRIDGKKQSVSLHLQDESQRLKLASGKGRYTGNVQMFTSRWCHFSVSGNGYFSIKVWN